tara:strand:+ start:2354 stop:3526 length:1173 start_codon:yes stop_codon:yes gene_type:complete
MKSSTLTIFLSIILGTTLAHGVTNVVLPANAQAAINAAQDGDSIGLLPGAVGTLTINNKEIILKAQGDTPPVISKIESNGSKLTLIGLNVAEVNATDAGTPSKLVVHGGKYGRITSSVSDARISYAEANYLVLSKVAVVTACKIQGSSQHFQEVSLTEKIGVDIFDVGSRVTIRNTKIFDYYGGVSGSITERFIGIRVRNNADALIHNNLIYNCYDSTGYGIETDCGIGVFVKSSSSATILANVLWKCYVGHHNSQGKTRGDRLVYAPPSTILKNNYLWKNPSQVNGYTNGGVNSFENIKEDNASALVFVDMAAGDFTPHPSSALINGGPTDLQFTDRDGSRNDIGMFGGHDYIPNGRNSTKPVVISLELPIAVPRNGTATIKSTGATLK